VLSGIGFAASARYLISLGSTALNGGAAQDGAITARCVK
jgi:hypothetical protein